MNQNKIGTYWITEERDHYSDAVIFSRSFNTYDDAYSSYLERKAASVLNEVTVTKVERSLLVE